MADKIRLGIIGANIHRGWAVRSHLPAVVASPEFELTAVCTTRMESAEESRQKFGARLAFDDYHTMLAHPDVGQVAVVGRLDDRLGEVGHAFVVPAPGAATGDSAGDELVAWCRQRMANYKAPRGVTFTDELPLTASGKVRKHELRARLRDLARA